MDNIQEHVKAILEAIEHGPPLRPDLVKTPYRVQKAFEEIFSGYEVNIPGLFTVFEEDGEDQIVTLRGIEFSSTCEHHLQTFYGHASVAYLPNKKVIGASKMGRLVQAYAHRLQIQERMGRQIADDMMKYLAPKGVAVIIKASHMCIKCRGLKSQDSELVTSIMRGTFRENQSSRMEVLNLIGEI